MPKFRLGQEVFREDSRTSRTIRSVAVGNDGEVRYGLKGVKDPVPESELVAAER